MEQPVLSLLNLPTRCLGSWNSLTRAKRPKQKTIGAEN